MVCILSNYIRLEKRLEARVTSVIYTRKDAGRYLTLFFFAAQSNRELVVIVFTEKNVAH